jgi:hypothetical protein
VRCDGKPSNLLGGLGVCARTVTAQGWVQPLRGPVGCEFRIADGPATTAFDIAAASPGRLDLRPYLEDETRRSIDGGPLS